MPPHLKPMLGSSHNPNIGLGERSYSQGITPKASAAVTWIHEQAPQLLAHASVLPSLTKMPPSHWALFDPQVQSTLTEAACFSWSKGPHLISEPDSLLSYSNVHSLRPNSPFCHAIPPTNQRSGTRKKSGRLFTALQPGM